MTLGTARGGNSFLKRMLYFVPWYKTAHSCKEKLEAHQLRNNSLPPGSVSIRKSHILVRENLPQSTSVRCCNFPVWWYKLLFSHPGFSSCLCWMAYVLSLVTVLLSTYYFYLLLSTLRSIFKKKTYSFKMSFKVLLAKFPPRTPTMMSSILFSFRRSQVWVLNFKFIKCFHFAPNVIPFLIHFHEDTCHPNLIAVHLVLGRKISQGVGFKLAMRKRLSMCCK